MTCQPGMPPEIVSCQILPGDQARPGNHVTIRLVSWSPGKIWQETISGGMPGWQVMEDYQRWV